MLFYKVAKYFNVLPSELAELDSIELGKLYAFYTLEPRCEDLAKIEWAYTRYTIASCFSDSKSKLKIEDFMIDNLFKVDSIDELLEQKDKPIIVESKEQQSEMLMKLGAMKNRGIQKAANRAKDKRNKNKSKDLK